MNIGIIGCGWLGKDLAKSLINQGYKVFGTKTSIKGIEDLETENINGTIFNVTENSVEVGRQNYFEEADVLIVSITPRIRHRSSESAIREMETLTHFLKNLTRNPRIIYLNSTAVYNDKVEDCTEETHQLKKPYSEFEKLISSIPNYTILRLAGLVGSDRIIINRMAGKERKMPENACINLVTKQDVIAAMLQIISKSDITNRQIFNICSSEHPIKHLFYTKMCRKANLTPPQFILTEKEIAKKVSNNKLKKHLNFEFEYDNIESFYNEIFK